MKVKTSHSRKIVVLFFIAAYCFSYSQEKKTLNINRTNDAPKIDGVLDDAAWQNANEATGFVQFRPDMGVNETPETRTVVKMTYDDNAMYIGAYLYDDPELIMRQFNSRDNFGQSDFFGLILNPNNDSQNDTEFFVFSSGNQADAVATPSNGEDFGWNAVWDSAVKLVDDGWIVEMKIPYRALRFSNENIQTWGVQFHRQFRRDRAQYTWNPIDATKGNIGLYHGELKGLENIEPPLRLSFYPFVSNVVESFDGDTENDFNIGLDVKYGLTENFTLDATLIPDFSQAGFDNLTLNLGPFEQTFGEQRQFFTEGVDLFNKGNLFFSRRVGNRPSRKIEDNEEIVGEYPSEVKVLNAVKVSGRTLGGLGIGVFNAITEKTEAIIRETNEVINEGTGELETIITEQEEVVEPFSNYNILVVDQTFNGNSSISLVNTNVMREGSFRDANVTALVLDLSNKKNTFNIDAQVMVSNLNTVDSDKLTTGKSTFFAIRKTHGNLRYSFDHSYSDTKFNINDLGLNFRNNFNNFGVDVWYRTFKPTEKLNNYYIGAWINYRQLASPNTFTGSNGGISFNAQTKESLHNFGGNINYQWGKQYDYFEPRTDDQSRFFIYENRFNGNVWISSNYNNVFAIDANIGGATHFEENRETDTVWYGFSPRFRVSDKFLITYNNFGTITNKDRGYVTTLDNDDIIFGQRDRFSMTNSLAASYNFSPLTSLTLTLRNNWSTVTYDEDLYSLLENGYLTQETGVDFETIDYDPNINFNAWNLDFGYSWQFAPGSFLTALYRNRLFNRDEASEDSYTESLRTLFDQPITHVFSLRLQYFIDYSTLKNVFKKKNIQSL